MTIPVHYLQPDSSVGAAWEPQRLAHFGAEAFAQSSAATAQAFEDIIDTPGAPFSVVTICQADTALGDEATFRGLFNSSGDDDTDGSFVLFTRHNPTGELRAFYRSDSGVDILSGTPITTRVVFDGIAHIVQIFDTAIVSTGTLRAKVDSDSVDILDASYVRTSVGVLDLYSPAGDIRGPTPTVTGSMLGWVYFHALVGVDLEGSAATIETAFTNAFAGNPKNMHRACLATLAAIEAAVGDPSTDIHYAEIFRAGGSAAHGDTATLNGSTFVRAGVSP